MYPTGLLISCNDDPEARLSMMFSEQHRHQITRLITAFVLIYCCFHCLSRLNSLTRHPAVWFRTTFYLSGFKRGVWRHLSGSLYSSVFPPYTSMRDFFSIFFLSPPVVHYEQALCVCLCFWFVVGAASRLNRILISTPPKAFFLSCLFMPPSTSETFLWCWVSEGNDGRMGGVEMVGWWFFCFFVWVGGVSWLCTIRIVPGFNEEPVY